MPPVTGWKPPTLRSQGDISSCRATRKKARRARALSFRHAYGLDRPARRKSTTRASEPRVPAPQHVQTPTRIRRRPCTQAAPRSKSVPRLPLSGLQRPRVGQTDAPAETVALASPLTARQFVVVLACPHVDKIRCSNSNSGGRRHAATSSGKSRGRRTLTTPSSTRAPRVKFTKKARRDLEQRRRENVLFEMEQQQWVKQMR